VDLKGKSCVRRRDFIKAMAGFAAWPLAARAQQPADPPVIGLLLPLSLAAAAPNIEAFRSGLQDFGYFEGRNYTLEFRFADGQVERLPKLAAELVQLKPAVIIAASPPAAVAAHKATQAIPIVVSMSQDPVRLGLAASLSRPGRNVTGLWWGDDQLVGKQLELLTKALPGIARVGVFANLNDPTYDTLLKSLPAASGALGLTARIIDVRALSDLDNGFATGKRENLQAFLIGTNPYFTSHRAEITALAAKAKMPSMYGIREFVVTGGLMSYIISLTGMYRDAARFVDKILKGSSAADLPIERPTKFEFLINLKTAKALGLTFSPSFLATADEVIE
jgi:putative tryptophan/tyrosine transport system substrate-binding protein